MAMDADCMAMMAMQQPAPKEKPCKGLTLDCIAAMGCVVQLMAADLTGSIAAPHIHGKPNLWSATTVLAGKLGSALCRERGCQNVEYPGVVGPLKKKLKQQH